MLKWHTLEHAGHNMRLRPHEHTSYLPLGLLLLLVGFALITYTAQAASPGPQAGSVGLTGIMPGKAPTVAARITSPNDQQHFATSPVTFKGTCPENTLVELYKNDIFAGSTICTTTGTFSLDVDLLIGKNTMVAKVYDALNQPGPDSAPVTVYYDALPAQAGPITSTNFGGSQLILNTDAVFRGTFPQQELTVPLDVIGGTAPYAINIQWGDATNKVISRPDNASFSATHTYQKAGTYQISIQATDSTGRVAFLTVAAIVNGQPDVIATSAHTIDSSTVSKLLILWPLYAGAFAVVLSFWLGERREKQILRRHGQLIVS